MGLKRAVDKWRFHEWTPDDFATIRYECVATNVGRANRIISRIYEEAFRDVGISSPQFALLVALKISGGSSARELATSLGSDPSTVSRNTELMVRRGLISVETGSDRRVRTYRLTDAGDELIQTCVPRWKKAQRTALRYLGRSRWREMKRTLDRFAQRSRRSEKESP